MSDASAELPPEPPYTPRHLSPGALDTLLVVLKRMCAVDVAPVLPYDENRLRRRLDELVGGGPPDVPLAINSLLRTLEWTPAALTFPKIFLGRFSRLPPARQDAVLAALHESRIYERRGVFKLLASLCMMVYYAEPAVYARVGYDHNARVARAHRLPRPFDPARDGARR